MKIFDNRFIIFFILLFIKLKCQLIITSNDIESEKKRISNIFTKIFLEKTRTLLYQKKLEINNSTILNTVKKIRIINFSVVDNEYVPYFINEKNVLVYFPHKIKFVIKVDYYIDSPEKIKSKNFGVIPYNCIFKNYDQNNEFTSSFSSVFDSPHIIYDEYEKDEIFIEIIDTLKQDFWYTNENKIKDTIKKSVVSGINEYYEKIDPIIFYTINNIKHTIHLDTFVKLCDIQNLKKTYQCYYMGNLNNYTKMYLNKLTIDNEEFYENDGNYKILFHNELINNIIKETFSNIFIYEFNKSDSLTEFFKDEIKNDLEEEDSYIFQLTISDIVNKYEKNQIITNFTLINKLYNKGIIESTINITMKFNIKTNLTGFNFCYDSKFLHYYEINKNELFKLDKKTDLIDKLSQLLKKKISNEENCLFKDEGIDLMYFLKWLEKCEFIKEGLMCIGESMMNY